MTNGVAPLGDPLLGGPLAAGEQPNSVRQLGQGLVQLTWSTNFIGLTLEHSGKLPATRWNPVGNPVTIVNERFTVTVDVGQTQRFFRLRTL